MPSPATDHGCPYAQKMRSNPRFKAAKHRLIAFAGDESGTQAIEVLLIFVSILIPCFSAILLLQDVLFEYLEVTTLLVTSPFF